MQKRPMALKNIILVISTILFSTIALAQSPDTVFVRQGQNFDDTLIYATDTIIFESGMSKQILIGTTILPGTHNQMGAIGSGLYLQKVTKSDCQQDVTEFGGGMNDKVNSIFMTDTTLTVDITIYDNCCYEFLCDIAVDSVGTLNLIYYGYGSYCACTCCFGLIFHFTREKSPDYTDINAVLINDNRKTIKQIK